MCSGALATAHDHATTHRQEWTPYILFYYGFQEIILGQKKSWTWSDQQKKLNVIQFSSIKKRILKHQPRFNAVYRPIIKRNRGTKK